MKNSTKRILSVLLMAVMMFVTVIPFISDDADAASTYLRIYGRNRYETAMRVAKNVKAAQGVSKFDSIILASGTSFPDALSGSYLSGVTGAPILLINENRYADSVIAYAKKNLKRGGKVYILGGEGAVPKSIEFKIKNAGMSNITRLGGMDRYETNLEILKEGDKLYAQKNGGLLQQRCLICSGAGFADSLGAGATGYPILLVGRDIREDQKEYLSGRKSMTYYMIGGEAAVSPRVELSASMLGRTRRAAGADRYSTAVKTAEMFYGTNPREVVVVYGQDFADGLAAAALAQAKKCPILLSNEKNIAQSYNYEKSANISYATIVGGPSLVSLMNIAVPGAGLRVGWNTVKDRYVYVAANGLVAVSPFTLSGFTITPSPGGIVDESGRAKLNRIMQIMGVGTGIVVYIDTQTLYYVRNGNIIFQSDVVTGQVGQHDTPTGTYHIRSKRMYVTLEDREQTYSSEVVYWCPFWGEKYGVHDSTWRTRFGGNIYQYNGSHGCINLPKYKMAQLWDLISVGTKIVIRKS